MAKPKKLSEISSLKQKKESLKKYLHKNPDMLRNFFINFRFDFEDMEFEVNSDFVCCPFCKDEGYHGQVNYNEETGKHNIYCFKCSEINNEGHAYTPWDYLTKIYRIEKGGLSFLDAVISLFKSYDDFEKAFKGEEVGLKEKKSQPLEDKQQIYIDEIYNRCNGNVLNFIDELYSQCLLDDIEPYINMYNNIENSVATLDWDDIDQNVEIFGQSHIPIKVIDYKLFKNYVNSDLDSKNIRKLFSDGNYYLYMIPTTTSTGKVIQIAFRLVDGEASKYKPKVKKVKAPPEKMNIPTLFGFHNFADFQKGMPIALVEGEKDAIALQTIYPYTLAMGRNTLGNNIKYLKYLTNDFIIIPDNDEAGLRGYEKIKRDMDKYGLKLHPIFIPKNSGFKDVADIYSQPLWDQLTRLMNNVKKRFNI